MAGKNKIVLERIAKDTERKLSFKRRKAGLIVEEGSTLCGVESAVVMYDPGEDEPTVWPSHIMKRCPKGYKGLRKKQWQEKPQIK